MCSGLLAILLMRGEVDNFQPAWYPAAKETDIHKRTPGQVQRGAARFLARLGTPAHATGTAGKGKGRAKGYHPAPRTRFPIVKKTKSGSNQLASP